MEPQQLYQLRSEDEIPPTVIQQVLDHLLPFTALLAAVRQTPSGQIVRLAGSGTFVEASGKSYILTAGHVWTDGLRSADSLAVFLGGKDIGITIRMELIFGNLFGQPPFDDLLWGPDMALLEIPDRFRRTIEAHGSNAFYNMDRVRNDMLAADASPVPGPWMIVGASEEASPRVEGDPLDVRGFGLFGFEPSFSSIGDYDFVDVRVDPLNSGSLPDRLNGLSGGGLWWTPLTKVRNTGEIRWDGERRLEGVVFREEFDPQRIVRCHGRRSLYRSVLDRVSPPVA